MGKYVIAGNWKMNKTPDEAAALIEAIKPLVKDAQCEVIVGVPFVDLPAALEAVKGSAIGRGCAELPLGKVRRVHRRDFCRDAQGDAGRHCHPRPQRAPHYFGDTDVTVAKRVRAALDAGLRVILCVGEYLEQREPRA